ncbi:uncharacterized protein LOC118220005 [Anguilla anguilla]|uniref:uncharacterized protein LOC118220005 n=1 Tax=Anguilla anguilla TaxID=7936 RepID=UPI0015B328BE|nr:uncharacterized protein LOC118220005 [Anguilla anguilla]
MHIFSKIQSFAVLLHPIFMSFTCFMHLLDLVILRDCSSSDPTVTPLHQSDHHFISFSLPLAPLPPSPPSTPTVMVCCNVRSLSPSSLASSVTASLPPLESFSSLPTDSASSALSSSLSSALYSLCPLLSKPARSSPPSPWMSDPLRTNRASLRAAERKWRKSMAQSDLSAYQSLLAGFSTATSTSPASDLATRQRPHSSRSVTRFTPHKQPPVRPS